MLPKRKRVTKEVFQGIMKTGRTTSSPLFVFRYISSSTPQYAFVAPKSIAKNAISRNKLRRQGYNTLRLYKLKPYAGIFFYKKGAQNSTPQEIKESISTILSKI